MYQICEPQCGYPSHPVPSVVYELPKPGFIQDLTPGQIIGASGIVTGFATAGAVATASAAAATGIAGYFGYKAAERLRKKWTSSEEDGERVNNNNPSRLKDQDLDDRRPVRSEKAKMRGEQFPARGDRESVWNAGLSEKTIPAYLKDQASTSRQEASSTSKRSNDDVKKTDFDGSFSQQSNVMSKRQRLAKSANSRPEGNFFLKQQKTVIVS